MKGKTLDVAVAEFIAPFRKKPGIIGALIVGSFAVGLETKRSDVDICLIAADTIRRWERGNRVQGGFLIEYAVYPIGYLRRLEALDILDGKRLRTRMLATGKILFDSHQRVASLQNRARKELRRRLPVLNKTQIELSKYYLWDQLDNLSELPVGTPSFEYAYHAALHEIVERYAAFLGIELPRPGRMYRFITDANFRKRYRITGIRDPVFKRLFVTAMSASSLVSIQKLTRYVQAKMGGFSIDGWVLSGNVDA